MSRLLFAGRIVQAACLTANGRTFGNVWVYGRRLTPRLKADLFDAHRHLEDIRERVLPQELRHGVHPQWSDPREQLGLTSEQ